ncbi:3'-5' exonuclease, partial [Paenibacillus larvae]
MVADAPSWSEVWAQVQKLLTGKTMLIYNADFDTRMIRNNCKRHNLSYIPFESFCVMQTYAEFVGSYSKDQRDFTWVGLVDAAYDLDIQIIGSHRAKADCITCARIINRIVAKRRVEVESAKKLSPYN